jgi:hypothetical protein
MQEGNVPRAVKQRKPNGAGASKARKPRPSDSGSKADSRVYQTDRSSIHLRPTVVPGSGRNVQAAQQNPSSALSGSNMHIEFVRPILTSMSGAETLPALITTNMPSNVGGMPLFYGR